MNVIMQQVHRMVQLIITRTVKPMCETTTEWLCNTTRANTTRAIHTYNCKLEHNVTTKQQTSQLK